MLIHARRLAVVGVAAASWSVAAVGPAGAATTTDSGPSASTGAPDGVSTVVASADWGITDGKPWYQVTQGELVAAPDFTTTAVSPAVTTACHEEISNITLGGAGPTFHWSTEQICTGNFAPQSLKTQLWRSSWSGPRGYGGWSYSDWTNSTQLGPIYWGIRCNLHHGYYDYYPVMQGEAAFGSGPVVRSGNQLNQQPCGPNPP